MMVIFKGKMYKFTNSGWRKFLERWLEIGTMPRVDLFAVYVSNTAQDITRWSIPEVLNALTTRD